MLDRIQMVRHEQPGGSGQQRQVLILLFACILLLGSHDLAGQSIAPAQGIRGGVGYLSAPPDAPYGLQLFGIHASGWGGFLDAVYGRRSPEGDSEFIKDLSADDARRIHGDHQFQNMDAWRAVYTGAVRTLTPTFALYLGGGVAFRDVYSEFQDSTRERGNTYGYYWVRDVEASGAGGALVAGVHLLLVSRATAHFGVGTRPFGVRVGVTYLIGSHS